MFSSLQAVIRPRQRRRLALQQLEERTVPSVTAVNELFTTPAATAATLNVLGPVATVSGEPVGLAAVGAVSPSGPTLTKNADGTLTFTSANTGTFTFNYSATGAQQAVTASTGLPGDMSGSSVAIDGNTLVVGAPQATVNNHAGQGAAYVFTLANGTWTLQQSLTASDGAAFDKFGDSVAISGNTVVLGAIDHAVGMRNLQGEAYVFTRSGSTWTQQQELTENAGGTEELFGQSVAIDGTTLVETDSTTSWVYTLAGGTWTALQQLSTGGSSLAFDGASMVVGNPFANSGRGAAASVFTLSGGTWTLQQTLTPADGAANELFGRSVAVDGNTLVVGSMGAPTEFGSVPPGTAYVYTRSGTTWTQQQELTAADGANGDEFGYSVALSATALVVGANNHQVGGNAGQGAAYVYALNGTTWTLQQEATAADGKALDMFATSVALEGATLVAGAPDHTVGGNSDQGAVYAQADIQVSSATATVAVTPASFTATAGTPATLNLLGSSQAAGVQFVSAGPIAPSGPTLVQNADGSLTFTSANAGTYTFNYNAAAPPQEVMATDVGAGNDRFGASVAISGNTAVVGSPFHAVNGQAEEGAAYVYTLANGSWVLQQELTASDGAADSTFGSSVAISGDTLVVGSPYHQVNGSNNQGAAYVFTRSGATWTQQPQILTASDGAPADLFGSSVALNGGNLVVGAPFHMVGNVANQGAAYVFTLTGGTWTQQQEITTTESYFGTSVAVSGNILIVGTPEAYQSTVNGPGAAYVYTQPAAGGVWTQQQHLTASDAAVDANFGASVAVSGNTVVVGAPDHAAAGAAYVFARTGSTWTQEQELNGTTIGDLFGGGVSVSGNAVVVCAPFHAGVGAAYVFALTGTTWTQQEVVTRADGIDYDPFGIGSAVALDGANLIVGAPYHQPANSATGGAAYFVNAALASATTTVAVTLAITPIGSQMVGDGTPLSFTVATQGSNGAAVTFSLAAPMLGATIDAKTGVFTWTPSEPNGQAPGTYTFTVNAVVANAPQTAAAQTFTVTVGPSSTNQGQGIGARTLVAGGIANSAEYYSNIITAAYNKYLGRAPEGSGLLYWVNQMLGGLTDEHLEAGFIGSAEYIADHGGTGANWITGMYVNLLGRTPAASEVQYWVTQLTNGEAPSAVAYGFAASQERESQHVQADYQQYLGRAASSSEVAYWVNVFLNGGTNEQVVAGFVASQEYFQSHGNNIVDWLFADYRATLNRQPDNAGYQYWESQL